MAPGVVRSALVLVLVLALPTLALARPKGRKARLAHAVVAGTVFKENGLAFPGAQVELDAAPEPGKVNKFKKMKAITDARGEFAFHVAPGPARYVLRAGAPGWQAQEKTAAIAAGERVDVFFRLEPASKQ